MRVVVTIDGELLISLGYNAGIAEQKAAIRRVVEAMGNLLCSGNQIVICHGNAPQIGTVLLRSEAARNIIYPLPLDVCSADTQGATGYMFQQAIQCWLEQHGIHQEIVTLITQVVVSEKDYDINPAKKGIGPYFDRELAQQYHTTRGWDMEMVPGYGYRRAVPLFMPERIIETNSIRILVESGTLVICAGGGGIPVRIDAQGMRIGIDAVVDKAYTTGLLAREIQAEAIIFVTPLEDLVGVLGPDSSTRVLLLDPATLEILIEERIALDDPIRHKLVAGRTFIRSGGKLVMIVPPNELGELPRIGYGIFLDNGEDSTVLRHSILELHDRISNRS